MPVKVVYHCYGGAHSSVTAASIHLGMLPAGRVPEMKEFWRIPLFDRQDTDQHGYLFFIGEDEYGVEVYVVARRGQPQVLENILKGLASMFDVPAGDYLLVNVMEKANLTMKIGGFLSRAWGFTGMGRPIVTRGTQKAYFKVVDLVVQVKRRLKEIHEEKSALFQRQPLSAGGGGRRDSHGDNAGKRIPGGGRIEKASFPAAAEKRERKHIIPRE